MTSHDRTIVHSEWTGKEEVQEMNVYEEIRALARNAEPEVALARISELDSKGLATPNLLVLKSMCILQLDSDQGYSLDDAHTALLKALDIDNEYVDALIELGYFHLNVND